MAVTRSLSDASGRFRGQGRAEPRPGRRRDPGAADSPPPVRGLAAKGPHPPGFRASLTIAQGIGKRPFAEVAGLITRLEMNDERAGEGRSGPPRGPLRGCSKAFGLRTVAERGKGRASGSSLVGGRRS